MIVATAMVVGCKSRESTSSAKENAILGAKATQDPKTSAQLESQFVIGPDAARELNARVDWQYAQGDRKLHDIWVQGDSAFILNDLNFLTRLRIDGGDRLWHVPVADPVEEIIGLNFVGEYVYLTTGGALLVLDANTGAQTGRQTLEKIANTQPLVLDQFLVYGARNGQVIWHSYRVGSMWRGYQVGPSIQIPPVMADQYLVVIGSDGNVMVLNAANATQYWSKKLLSSVVAAPAAGNGAVFVAGLDQHIRAFNIGTGHSLWRTLTESPLTQGPSLIGDYVYQQVPEVGLVCFEAQPLNSPGGKVAWTATDIPGSVVMRRRDQLFVWDYASRNLNILEPNRGGVIKTLQLPRVKKLLVPDMTGANGDIYAVDDRCHLVRLVPRN
jgi:hypothetical protein